MHRRVLFIVFFVVPLLPSPLLGATFNETLNPIGADTGLYRGDIAVGDLDRDNRLDLVVTGGDTTDRRFLTLMNTGSFSFTRMNRPDNFTEGFEKSSQVITDFDRDGDGDVVVSGEHEGTTELLFVANDTDGLNQAGFVIASGFGFGGSDLALVDYDRDGDRDLVGVGRRAGVGPRFYTMNRRDTVADFDRDDAPLGTTDGVEDAAVTAGDVTGDGQPELVTAGEQSDGTHRLIVWEQSGSSWTILDEPMGINQGVTNGDVVLGDITEDGTLDLVVTGIDNAGTQRFIVFTNDGAGNFSQSAEPMGTNTGLTKSSVDLGDFDNDGDLDPVVIGKDNAGNERFIVFRNDGGSYSSVAEPLGADNGVFRGDVEWADLDGDGQLDLAVTGQQNDGSARFVLFENQSGNGSNNQPTSPSPVTSDKAGFDQGGALTLDWDPPTDNETPQSSLSYRVRIGNHSGGIDVREADPFDTTTLSEHSRGLVQTDQLTLQSDTIFRSDTYWWSVRAIDHQQGQSPWSTERRIFVRGKRAFDTPNLQVTSNDRTLVESRLSGKADTIGELHEGYGQTVSVPIENASNATLYYAVNDTAVRSDNSLSMTRNGTVNGVDNWEATIPDGAAGQYDRINFFIEANGPYGDPIIDDQGQQYSYRLKTFARDTFPVGQNNGFRQGGMAWSDMDDDGDQDVAVHGRDTNDNPTFHIYRNNGGSDFTLFDQPFGGDGAKFGSMDWGDMDGDGDGDLVFAGTVNGNRRFVVFENTGSDFVIADQPEGSGFGTQFGMVRWGDYDHNGRLDLAVAGQKGTSETGNYFALYKQTAGGTFALDQFPLDDIVGDTVGFEQGAIRFVDYDRDGLQELSVIGQSEELRHDGVTSDRGQRFFLLDNVSDSDGAGADWVLDHQPMGEDKGLQFADQTWADIDNDGDLDVAITGRNNKFRERTHVYENTGSGFTLVDQPAGNNNGYTGSLDFGDYNNDGVVDLVGVGKYTVPAVYTGDGSGNFNLDHRFYRPLQNDVTKSPDARFVDYTADGQLDLALIGQDGSSGQRVFTLFEGGGAYPVNSIPSPPTISSPSDTVPQGRPTVLAHNGGSDNETTNNALTYRLRVGSSPGGRDIVAPADGPDTLTARHNGLFHGDTYVLHSDTTLPTGTYYWSVRTVDQGNQQSGWSAEQSFEVVNVSPFTRLDTGYVRENNSLSVAAPGVLANDYDTNFDELTVTGTARSPDHGSLSLSSDGSYTYDPTTDYNGYDTFSYTVADGNGGSSQEDVRVFVNRLPEANPDYDTFPEDTVRTVNVLENDTAFKADFVFDTTASVSVKHGTITDSTAAGTVAYSPDPDFNGSDSFVYRLEDEFNESDTARVHFTITSVNDAPRLSSDTYTFDEDTTLSVGPDGLLANDTDVDAGDTMVVLGTTPPDHGSITADSDGSFTYTPAVNYSGFDTVTYTVADNHDSTVSDSVTFNVRSVPDGFLSADTTVLDRTEVSLGESNLQAASTVTNRGEETATVDTATLRFDGLPDTQFTINRTDGISSVAVGDTARLTFSLDISTDGETGVGTARPDLTGAQFDTDPASDTWSVLDIGELVVESIRWDQDRYTLRDGPALNYTADTAVWTVTVKNTRGVQKRPRPDTDDLRVKHETADTVTGLFTNWDTQSVSPIDGGETTTLQYVATLPDSTSRTAFGDLQVTLPGETLVYEETASGDTTLTSDTVPEQDSALTFVDPAETNPGTITSYDSRVQLAIPDGKYPDTTTVSFDQSLSDDCVTTANNNLDGDFVEADSLIGSVRSVIVSDDPLTDDAVTVTWSVDSSDVEEPGSMIGVHLNESKCRWEQTTPKTLTANANQVVFETPHFSIFRVVVLKTVPDDLSQFTVTPNPYKPNDGNPETGEPYDGSAGTGVYFLDLPETTRLEIYTLLNGEQVAETTVPNGGDVQWDGRNDFGQTVASGWYLYKVKDQNNNTVKTGKFAILR